MEYKTVICGGTFDRLHAGHTYFLREMFSIGERVLIGLTSDTYVHMHKNRNILPFQERLEELKTFLAAEGLLIRAEIFPIQDIYGKAIDPSIALDAIIVSSETRKGGEEINKKRGELGLSILPLVEIPLKKISESTISSTKIREGWIGRDGEVYLDNKWTQKTLALPSQLREILHKPFHTLFTSEIPHALVSSTDNVVTVGDAVTKRFNDGGTNQALSVIDFSIERKSIFHSTKDLGFSGSEKVFHIKNPAGYIRPEVWKSLEDAVNESKKKQTIVVVNGEEDLLVIPLVLLLPLGWKLFYGQPKEGVVYVPITEQTKRKVYDFLLQFVPE